MDQALTIDDELQNLTRTFLSREWSVESARGWNARPEDLLSLWAKVSDLGWFVAGAPEEDGGLGLGLSAAIGIINEAAYHFVPGPLFENIVLRHQLAKFAPAPLGDVSMLTLAWRAGIFGHRDPHPPQIEQGRLTGVSEAVECGDVADAYLVVAESEGVPAVALVRSGSGVSSSPAGVPDQVTRPVRVVFKDVIPEWTIGDARVASTLLDEITVYGALAAAAQLVGVSRRVLDLSVEYAKNRIQFDRPIGSFQAVQHMLSEMLVDVSIASTMLASTAQELEILENDANELVRSLKWFSGTAAKTVTEQALQVHGGIGFADEYPLGAMLKRTLFLRQCWGSERQHALVLGESSLSDVTKEI